MSTAVSYTSAYPHSDIWHPWETRPSAGQRGRTAILGFIAGAIAGALIGVLVTVVFQPPIEKRYRALFTRAAARRVVARQRKEDALRATLVQLYEGSGSGDTLYFTDTFNPPVRVPFLYDATLNATASLDGRSDQFVSVISPRRENLPSSARVVRAMERSGARLWDGNVLYAKSIDAEHEAPFLVGAGVCNYFAYVTEQHRIRRELTKGGRSQSVPNQLASLRTALTTRTAPITLAASAVCVFESTSGPQVAIQRRSSNVVSAPGTLGVIPLFGLESNREGTARSRYGVLTYNFLKEFMEELYGVEELTRAATSSKLHPDWIFELPKAGAVAEELDAGRLKLTSLGVGFDLRDASLTFALLAHFESPEFLRRLEIDLTPSEESAGKSSAEKPVSFRPLNGEELKASVANGELDSSSVFALDLVRAHFGLSG